MRHTLAHSFDFDPTYGFDLAGLRAIVPPEAPAGFDAFWQARYAKALAADPTIELRHSDEHDPRWHVQDIFFTSTDGVEIGGWLLLPSSGVIERGLVVGHGYGGRDRPDLDFPVKNTAVLFPCLRGLSRSARAEVRGDAAGHVLHDIENPDRYIIGGCVEDTWVAVSVLQKLYPAIANKIGYAGTSFGGGIGALAIAFDKRIDRGHLVVPTFGNAPLWLSLPTVGSGNSVQSYCSTHPDTREDMRLFDSAVAASRITVPMLMAVALFDPAVAPPCQFSVANALSPTLPHETVVLDAGHFGYPGMTEQNAALREKVRAFFRAD